MSPNILLITSDQHRADFLGCAGGGLATPHLDQLANEGLRFDNAYVDCPVCVPARTTLITGRRAYQNGQPAYAGDWRLPRRRSDFLGSLLTEAGYQTELIGKTHWHTEPDFRGGFEHVTWLSELKRQQLVETGRPGTLVGLGFNETSPTLSPFPRHLHSTDWCVDKACDFLETRDRSQPFALWVSLLDPHPPLTIHEPYYSLYDGPRGDDLPTPVVPDWVGTDREPYELYCQRHTCNSGPMSPQQMRHARAVYAGMISNLDHQVGRLRGQLEAFGDFSNTLVIYTSDHGEAVGDHGTMGKRSFLNHSARVPLIVRPPSAWDASPGRVSRDLVELADLLPTLCDVAKARVPSDVTGRSLLPALRGDCLGDHLMHGQIQQSHMLHDGCRKYMYSTADGSELCFDVESDPHDERPLDAAATASMRERFVEVLRNEDHADLVDGSLRNDHLERPSVADLRAKDSSGLGAASYLGQSQRSIMHIH